jgi:hypothetical protein
MCGSVLMARFVAARITPGADAPHQHVVAADVRFVGQGGRVDGLQHHVVPARQQLGRERVVTQAAAAVHLSGTRC